MSDFTFSPIKGFLLRVRKARTTEEVVAIEVEAVDHGLTRAESRRLAMAVASKTREIEAASKPKTT